MFLGRPPCGHPVMAATERRRPFEAFEAMRWCILSAALLGSPGGRAVRWVVGSGCDRCGRLGAPHGSALSQPLLCSAALRGLALGAYAGPARVLLRRTNFRAMGWTGPGFQCATGR